MRTLTGRGVQVQFVKEQLTFTGDDTAMATLLLSVMGAFAEFERSLIRERQREGIALARQRGAYRGRVRALNAEQVAQLRQRVADGTPKATLAREFGVSRETVYQYQLPLPLLPLSPLEHSSHSTRPVPSHVRPSPMSTTPTPNSVSGRPANTRTVPLPGSVSERV